MVNKYDIVRIARDCPRDSPIYADGVTDIFTGLGVEYWVSSVQALNGGHSEVRLRPRDKRLDVDRGAGDYEFDAAQLEVVQSVNDRDDLCLQLYRLNSGNGQGGKLTVAGTYMNNLFSQGWHPTVVPLEFVKDYWEMFNQTTQLVPLRAALSRTTQRPYVVLHTEDQPAPYQHPNLAFEHPTVDEEVEEDF